MITLYNPTTDHEETFRSLALDAFTVTGDGTLLLHFPGRPVALPNWPEDWAIKGGEGEFERPGPETLRALLGGAEPSTGDQR